MSRFYEAAEFRHLPEEAVETSGLPPSKLSLLLEHLFIIMEKGEITIAAILTPEHHTTGPIEVFIAPTTENLTPSALSAFQVAVFSPNLPVRPKDSEGCGLVYKGDIPMQLREFVEDGSLYIPSITFTEEFSKQQEYVTRTKSPLVGGSPILTKLGLSGLLKNTEGRASTTTNESVSVAIYIYTNSSLAALTARSVQHLVRQPSLFNLTVFKQAVERYIPPRFLHRSRLPSPENYLHERGILAAMEAQ